MWIVAVAVLLQQTPSIGQSPPPDTVSAYANAGTRELVARARARREVTDASIRRYSALAREHISFGIQALRRDRLLYRRELAARVTWRRDAPGRVEVVGAREAIPAVLRGVRVPEDLRRAAPDLAFDPTDDRLLLGMGSDSSFLRHPLAPGGEAHYRFAVGDTTTLRLPDGRTLRLVELRVTPRRRDPHLLRGSLWLDGESAAVVRAVVRLADAFDLERDDPDPDDDAKDIPGVLKPIRADLRYLTVDYGLVDFRWWLPRTIAVDGWAEMGNFMRFPLRFERSYSAYEVSGDTATGAIRRAEAPPGPIDRRACRMERGSGSGLACTCHERRCRYYDVVIPADSAALLASAALPASPFAEGEALVTEAELRDVAKQLRLMPAAEWRADRPTLAWGLGRAGLVRFNRVEGISVGARAQEDFGRLAVDGTVRLGFAAGADDPDTGRHRGAQLSPDVVVGITHETTSSTFRLAAYRRLAVVDPATRALGIGNSLSALVLGRDDGDYFRATGLELTRRGVPVGEERLSWRLFAERQGAVTRNTDWSLPRLFGSDERFRENLRADRADEAGGEASLRIERGLDPRGIRWGLVLAAEGAAGTFDYLRPAVTARLGFPMPLRLVGSVEGAAGTSLGTLPTQRLWLLGGPATLRGYGGDGIHGAAFWRGRAELATSLPAARLAVFGDAGWAGERGGFTTGGPLLSAGAGASFLDGLLRVDLARALRGTPGWRLDVYLDGLL